MKNDWKDDIFSGVRKYTMTTNADGTVSLADATTYTQQGDVLGAKELNEIGDEVNSLRHALQVTLTVSGWSNTYPYTQIVNADSVTSEDSPTLVKVLESTASLTDVKAYNKAFGLLFDGLCGNGYVTFYAYKKPSVEIVVGLQGVIGNV